MKLHIKALYNLLRLNYLEDSSIEVEKWQVEDLSLLSKNTLFKRLEILGFQLDEKTFFSLAERSSCPEEMVEHLYDQEKKTKRYDEAYLYLFELWKRLCPSKQCISIFCDELDQAIYKYDTAQLENDEGIQDILVNLEEVLDKNTEIGEAPSEIFCALSEYCAHDIENFLYDYISDQIDILNYVYARELIEGFYSYMLEGKWFDFLQAKCLASEDISKANEMIANLLKELKKKSDIDLQLEILQFMVEAGDRSLFTALVKKTLSSLENEGDFFDLLSIVAEYYKRLDREEMEKAIQKIMDQRSEKNVSQKISLKDPDLKAFLKLVSSKSA